jgi:hypothetical protein
VVNKGVVSLDGNEECGMKDNLSAQTKLNLAQQAVSLAGFRPGGFTLVSGAVHLEVRVPIVFDDFEVDQARRVEQVWEKLLEAIQVKERQRLLVSVPSQPPGVTPVNDAWNQQVAGFGARKKRETA